MKRMESAKKNSKSKGSSTKRAQRSARRASAPRAKFVVCVKSGGYVDLEPLKVYRVERDRTASTQGLIRVVDSSGEDYLYPQDFFLPIQATPRLFEIAKTFA